MKAEQNTTQAEQFDHRVDAYADGYEDGLLAARKEKQERVMRGRFASSYPIALAACLVLIGFFVGKMIEFDRNSDAMLRAEIGQMRQMILAYQLNQSSITERIDAVRKVSGWVESSHTRSDMLFSTLRYDHAENVKLAALESLAPLLGDPIARSTLLETALLEQSANVQIEMLKYLVRYGDERDYKPLADHMISQGYDAVYLQRLTTKEPQHI